MTQITLTDEQLAVIHHPLGMHARVLAVAGSGKSFTMACRIQYLVQECNIPPHAIQVLMFNRLARQQFRVHLDRTGRTARCASARGAHLHRDFREGQLFALPKTKAGRRTILLGTNGITKLREQWRRQDQERAFAGTRWQENDLIFPSSVGTPMDHRNLVRNFKRLIKLAGLPEIRFHDLRHTAASLMLNHGVPSIIVSRRLGHSRVSITLDTYGHLIPELQGEAAELMDELITPIPIELHTTAHELFNPPRK